MRWPSFLDDMQEHSEKLPEKPELEELRETAQKFVKDVRASGASEAMAAAEAALAEFAPTRGHEKAKEAADILDKFMKNATAGRQWATRQGRLGFSRLCAIAWAIPSPNCWTAWAWAGGGGMMGGYGSIGLYGGLPEMLGGNEGESGDSHGGHEARPRTCRQAARRRIPMTRGPAKSSPPAPPPAKARVRFPSAIDARWDNTSNASPRKPERADIERARHKDRKARRMKMRKFKPRFIIHHSSFIISRLAVAALLLRRPPSPRPCPTPGNRAASPTASSKWPIWSTPARRAAAASPITS